LQAVNASKSQSGDATMESKTTLPQVPPDTQTSELAAGMARMAAVLRGLIGSDDEADSESADVEWQDYLASHDYKGGL
jgi:hypothetical protein